MTAKLPAYNREQAQSGALVCWENGDGPLRYIGPSTDPTCCGCFQWLDGPHKGTFASYQEPDLRMALAPLRRSDGWYFVRKLALRGEYTDWTPAEWRQESKAWYSSRFSGIPDTEMIVGSAIQHHETLEGHQHGT